MCPSWRYRKWFICHVTELYQAGAVSLAALFAIHTCLILTADDTWKKNRQQKTRPTGYVFQFKHSKRREAKNFSFFKWHFQGNYYDMPVWHVGANSSLWGFVRNQPVFHFIVMYFVLNREVGFFLTDLKYNKDVGLAPQHGSQNGITSPQLSWSATLALYLQLCGGHWWPIYVTSLQMLGVTVSHIWQNFQEEISQYAKSQVSSLIIALHMCAHANTHTHTQTDTHTHRILYIADQANWISKSFITFSSIQWTRIHWRVSIWSSSDVHDTTIHLSPFLLHIHMISTDSTEYTHTFF